MSAYRSTPEACPQDDGLNPWTWGDSRRGNPRYPQDIYRLEEQAQRTRNQGATALNPTALAVIRYWLSKGESVEYAARRAHTCGATVRMRFVKLRAQGEVCDREWLRTWEQVGRARPKWSAKQQKELYDAVWPLVVEKYLPKTGRPGVSAGGGSDNVVPFPGR